LEAYGFIYPSTEKEENSLSLSGNLRKPPLSFYSIDRNNHLISAKNSSEGSYDNYRES